MYVYETLPLAGPKKPHCKARSVTSTGIRGRRDRTVGHAVGALVLVVLGFDAAWLVGLTVGVAVVVVVAVGVRRGPHAWPPPARRVTPRPR